MSKYQTLTSSLRWIFLGSCLLILILVVLCAIAASPKISKFVPDGTPDWQRYSDPSHGFLIQYPSTTHPETLMDKEPGLVSRLAFDFEQPVHKGTTLGPLETRFKISVWQNPNRLTADAWAKQNSNPKLTLTIHPIQIAGRKGVTLRTTIMVGSITSNFVSDQDWMYEL